MLNVLDISRYIINYSNKKNYSITNSRLQKLLYFIQTFYLFYYSKPCFDAKIEAWSIGPVIPKSYQEFEIFGNAKIPTIEVYRVVINNSIIEIEFDEKIIPKEDRIILEQIIDILSEYSTFYLVALSRKLKPWLLSYKKTTEISLESIKNNF